MSIAETVTKKLKLFRKDKVFTLIDGHYDSLFQGKGLELDTLREYVVGDNVKDMDWPATARTGKPHTKLYTAARDQQLLIVPDTSRSMLIDGHTNLNKRDATYGVVALLGAFVKKNQDMIALHYYNEEGQIKKTRFNNTTQHIESILQKVDTSIMAGQSEAIDMEALLDEIVTTTKKRTAIFIISDGFKDLSKLEHSLKKLGRMHQLFYIQLAPSTPFLEESSTAGQARDIELGNKTDETLLMNQQLKKEWLILSNQYLEALRKTCRKYGTAFTYVVDESATVDAIQDIFNQARQYAQRRR